MVGDIAAVLRARGQRLTPQRQLILGALRAAGGHRTADELRAQIGASFPFINLATVYRTLYWLREQGLVAETDLGRGRREYEYIGESRHHHLVCLRCGATTEIADGALAPLAATLREGYGFAAQLDHFAIFGVCRGCRGAPGDEEERATSADEGPVR